MSRSRIEKKQKYCVTGSAAHYRLKPLLPKKWIDLSPYKERQYDDNTNENEPNNKNRNNSTDSDNRGDSRHIDSSSCSMSDNVSPGVGGVNSITTLNSDTNDKSENNSTPGTTSMMVPDFLWENAPRIETKGYRDFVKCYSHLPNGTCILDSKWVLARLFQQHQKQQQQQQGSDGSDSSSHLAVLETHCVRGRTGFLQFCNQMKKKQQQQLAAEKQSVLLLPDLLINNGEYPNPHNNNNYINNNMDDENTNNMWVIKDASSNGAGGIWVVSLQQQQNGVARRTNSNNDDPTTTTSNEHIFQNEETSPLIEEHKYVIQKYVYPPVLYQQRKCHVRVYALFTSDGKAYVHKRAFLHVANDTFHTKTTTTKYQDSVHITNCCANSHDDGKFSGEILADLKEATTTTTANKDDDATTTTNINSNVVVPLGKFYNSICASIQTLAKLSFPFLQGGEANHGFEYLGIDFILSYSSKTQQPIAYLLEVNAPPSQDTATGLHHAEQLHNDVVNDILTLWVIPKVSRGAIPPQSGGWSCIYDDNKDNNKKNAELKKTVEENESYKNNATQYILPSKAVLINKIRWALFERKMCKQCDSFDEKKKEGEENLFKNNDSITTTCITAPAASAATTTNSAITNPKQQQQLTQNNNVVEMLTIYARSHFPYFAEPSSYGYYSAYSPSYDSASPPPLSSFRKNNNPIFFENAGGSQVPKQVIDQMYSSLMCRHRNVIGSQTKRMAREILRRLLIDNSSDSITSSSSNMTNTTTCASSIIFAPVQKQEENQAESTKNDGKRKIRTTCRDNSSTGKNIPDDNTNDSKKNDNNTCNNKHVRNETDDGNDSNISGNDKSSKSSESRNVCSSCIDDNNMDTNSTNNSTTSSHNHTIFLGSNASQLLINLANLYVRKGYLSSKDEIIISTQNHLANVTPWLQAAKDTGAKVKWWRNGTTANAASFDSLVTYHTRCIVLSHTSNVLGQAMDHEELRRIRTIVNDKTKNYGHIIVDGVAAVPHIYPGDMLRCHDNNNNNNYIADWYVVSCHKFFGPHMGVLCGTNHVIRQLVEGKREQQQQQIWENSVEDVYKLLEVGTMNYEACAGIQGLAKYLVNLALLPLEEEEEQVEAQQKGYHHQSITTTKEEIVKDKENDSNERNNLSNGSLCSNGSNSGNGGSGYSGSSCGSSFENSFVGQEEHRLREQHQKLQQHGRQLQFSMMLNGQNYHHQQQQPQQNPSEQQTEGIKYLLSNNPLDNNNNNNCHNNNDNDNDNNNNNYNYNTNPSLLLKVLTPDLVKKAYRRIHIVEQSLVTTLLDGLRKSSNKIRIIEIQKNQNHNNTGEKYTNKHDIEKNNGSNSTCNNNYNNHHNHDNYIHKYDNNYYTNRLPVVSFIHSTIPSSTITKICQKAGIIIRNGTFLCNSYLLNDFNMSSSDGGFVRVSLLHYNTIPEINYLLNVLQSMPEW